ncbi:MAG: hypothetical protein HOV83_09605 [Catenulispora sp.]|nr:hypothetical protein [Catenulispora sp.]
MVGAGGLVAATPGAANAQAATTATAAATVTYTTTTNWGYGLQAEVTITPSVTVTQWTLEFDAADQQTLTFAGYAGSAQTGRHITLTNRSFNGTISAGTTLHLGVQFSNPAFTDVPPARFVFNGQATAYTPSPYIVVSADKPTVPPGGSSAVFVKLSQPPTATSVITVGSGSAAPIQSTPAQLTFTPSDWDVPQAVTLTSEGAAGSTNQSSSIWLQQQTGRPFYATDVLSATTASGSSAVASMVTNGYPTCRVQVLTYTPGFTVTVTIVNATAAPLSGWKVQFTLPAAATVSSAFNGALTRDGTVGTITSLPWNTTIPAGGQTTPGFTGYAVPFTPPSDFTLDGRPCTTV